MVRHLHLEAPQRLKVHIAELKVCFNYRLFLRKNSPRSAQGSPGATLEL